MLLPKIGPGPEPGPNFAPEQIDLCVTGKLTIHNNGPCCLYNSYI